MYIDIIRRLQENDSTRGPSKLALLDATFINRDRLLGLSGGENNVHAKNGFSYRGVRALISTRNPNQFFIVVRNDLGKKLVACDTETRLGSWCEIEGWPLQLEDLLGHDCCPFHAIELVMEECKYGGISYEELRLKTHLTYDLRHILSYLAESEKIKIDGNWVEKH